MAFGVGGRESRVFDSFGSQNGKKSGQMDVACDCWFTSRGETMPRALKFPDENGIMRMVKEIQVLSSEKKYYCGIPAVEYDCRIAFEGKWMPVRLVFYLEECRWVMETAGGG